jgi:hypothetical protein
MTHLTFPITVEDAAAALGLRPISIYKYHERYGIGTRNRWNRIEISQADLKEIESRRTSARIKKDTPERRGSCQITL